MCLICPAGKFQKFALAPVFCYDCPAGKYQDSAGTTACTSCPWGMVQRLSGQAQCIAEEGTRAQLEQPAVVDSALLSVIDKLKGEVTNLKTELADATASATARSV